MARVSGRSSLVALVALCALSFLAATVRAEAVVDLTAENFDQMTSDGKWIVEFYAPWCGHCQNLAPIFEESAQRIQKTYGDKLRLGKVDCTVHESLAGRFGIRGYPTLKFMRGGIVTDYNNERTVDAFLDFAKRVTGNPVSTVSASGVAKLRKSPVVFLLYSTGKHIIDPFTRVATKYQDLLRFAWSDDKKVLTDLAPQEFQDASDLLIMLNDDDTPTIYSGPWDFKSIDEFVSQHQLPLISEITGTSWEAIKLPGLRVVTAVIDPKQHMGIVSNIWKQVAKKFAGRYTFGYIDATNQRYRYFLADHNMTPERVPDFFVIDEKNNMFYEDITVNKNSVESISAFLTRVEEGGVDPKGPGASWLGHLGAVFRSMFREMSSSYAMMAIAGVLVLVLGLTIWMVCTGGGDDEEYEAMVRAAEAEEQEAKAKKEK